MKNKIKNLTYLFIVGLILVLFGITYSFFNFTDYSNELITNNGEVYMKLNKSNTNITLNNVFPETYEEALYVNGESGTLRTDNIIEFTVIGKNTYNDPVYYEIDLEYGDDINNKTRIDDKYLKFELLDITDSNNIETIFSNESFDSIDEKKIFVDTINSTNYTRTYRLRMWYDENIIISDTDPEANFKASNNEYQTENSSLPLYTEQFASVKVKVYGDFESKSLYNVMGTLPTSITNEKNSIKEIYFINEKQNIINQRYNSATIRENVTNTSRTEGTQRLRNMSDYGLVLAWLEPIENTSNYKLYIGSEGYTYLSTGNRLFFYFSNTTTMDLTNVRTNFVTTMDYMFYGCSSLASLDVSNLNTSNVTTMNGMFGLCSSLTSLDLSNFNTSNVTYMDSMFQYCSQLTSIDISNFNTSNVTTMYQMFQDCSSLTSIGLSNFNTSNVTTMQNMFYNCSSLTSLNVSNLNAGNVTNMVSMFNGCSSLTSLNLSSFNISNVKNMQSMFNGCSSLTSLDLSSLNTNKVTDMASMFYNCSSLTSLNISNFNTSKVTNMASMFYNCSSLTSLDLSSFNTSNVTRMRSMFNNCVILNTIYVLNDWDFSNLTDCDNMFSNCNSLKGGSGTSYDISHEHDYRYACIDGGTSNPGYFTLKSS